MQRLSLCLATIVLIAAVGCADGALYSSTAPTTVSLTGVYAGPVSGLVAAAPFASGLTYTLTQNGKAVSGTWSTAAGNAGTATGTISGSSVAFTLVQTAPCTGSVSGTATISNGGTTLTGSYAGTVCGQALSASFTVTRP